MSSGGVETSLGPMCVFWKKHANAFSYNVSVGGIASSTHSSRNTSLHKELEHFTVLHHNNYNAILYKLKSQAKKRLNGKGGLRGGVAWKQKEADKPNKEQEDGPPKPAPRSDATKDVDPVERTV
jgi:hypothetical protein